MSFVERSIILRPYISLCGLGPIKPFRNYSAFHLYKMSSFHNSSFVHIVLVPCHTQSKAGTPKTRIAFYEEL